MVQRSESSLHQHIQEMQRQEEASEAVLDEVRYLGGILEHDLDRQQLYEDPLIQYRVNPELVEAMADVLESEAFRTLVDRGKITVAALRPNLHHKGIPEATDAQVERAIDERIEASELEQLVKFSLALEDEDVQNFYALVMDKLRKFAPEEVANVNVVNQLRKLMLEGPVTYYILYDSDGEAVRKWRDITGVTDPKKAAEGTIRGDMAVDLRNNLVHGTGEPEEVERELGLIVDFLERRTRV